MGSQDGFQLIEVMISALLCGLVAVATFTGLQAVNHSTGDQRLHSEASVIAAQSQEQLRTLPASGLEAIELTSHVYTTTVDGTKYTVTQKAEALGESGQNTACTVASQSQHGLAPNIRIISSVRWPQLPSSRPAVAQSSVITPPAGSSLEVDVVNSEAVTAGVSGVTAIIKYTPIETKAVVTREGTTSQAGCVLFGGIRATSASVEIPEKANFVTPSGALKVAPAEVTIAPNVTTHHDVLYDEAGAIEATFTYSGKTVSGDTFVAANNSMQVPPELELGGTKVSAEAKGEELYTVTPGCTAASLCPTIVPYASETVQSKSATATKYLLGDLFPFPSNSKWSVYAGDCKENNALVVTHEAVKNALATVQAGKTTTVEVPVGYVELQLYKGSQKSPSSEHATGPYTVKITNTSCSNASPALALPNHAASASFIHYQNATGEGLEVPYQPYGTFELCLAAPEKRRDRITYTNASTAVVKKVIYPEEISAAEKTKQREEKEAATKKEREGVESTKKGTRVKEEAAAWEAIENEEAAEAKTRESEEATKAKRLSTEKSEREKWEKEKLTFKEKQTKEKAQETTRKAAEKTEETAANKRKGEETTTLNKREAQETTRKNKEKEEGTAKGNSEKEEGNTKTAKVNEEKEEVAGKVVNVESGSGSC